MLVIRKDQLKLLQAQRVSRFETRVVTHVRENFQHEADKLSDNQLLYQIRNLVPRAEKFGLHTERQITAFVDASYLLSDGFEDNQQYGDIVQMLSDADLTADEKMTILIAVAYARTNNG